MGLTFYSATKANTGSLMSVSFNSKDEAVWIKLIKQTGSNSNNGKFTGVYKDGAYVNIKLSADEAGGLIKALRTDSRYSLIHKTEKATTTLSLAYYKIDKSDKGPEKTGFGITVKQGETEWKCGLSTAAGENLLEYLRFALTHIYSAIYAKDKEFAKNKEQEGGKQKPGTPQQAATPTPAPSQDLEDGGQGGSDDAPF